MEIINLNTNNQNPEIREMNVLQRMIGIIVNPVETMKSIAEKPTMLFAVILMAAAPALLYFLRASLYGDFMKYIMEMTMASSNSSAQVTPEQMQASIGIYTKLGPVIAGVGGLFGWFVGAAVLFGIMKIFKGQGTFKQYLSITAFASVIMSVYYLLSLALSYVTGTLLLNSSLALLVPDMKGELTYGLLRILDLFYVWHYAVIGIGVAVVSKVSKAKVYPVVAIVFIVSMLIGINSYKYM
ncbi:MAG: YIP1 family protein [Clostridia bacterium]|nr:YIP1 family protein [Clostridia bacterium]